MKLFPAVMAFLLFTGCASVQATKSLNTVPENLKRGDPNNPVLVKEYLQSVLDSPDEYTVKAFKRKAYNIDTKKSLFLYHSFYVFFKDGELEHTLVFTATPKGSEYDGAWMFDAATDRDSYNLYITSDNPWEVEEYQGPRGETALDTPQTAANVLKRLEKGYTFFGAAHVANLPWYHQLWMFLIPPPVIAYTPLLLASIHADSCNSAVLETMVWERG
jgi:hypothetical protein